MSQKCQRHFCTTPGRRGVGLGHCTNVCQPLCTSSNLCENRVQGECRALERVGRRQEEFWSGVVLGAGSGRQDSDSAVTLHLSLHLQVARSSFWLSGLLQSCPREKLPLLLKSAAAAPFPALGSADCGSLGSGSCFEFIKGLILSHIIQSFLPSVNYLIDNLGFSQMLKVSKGILMWFCFQHQRKHESPC